MSTKATVKLAYIIISNGSSHIMKMFRHVLIESCIYQLVCSANKYFANLTTESER